MLKKALMGAVAAVTLFAAGSANAVVFVFSGDVDPTASVLNASASADVSFSGSTGTVILSNTTANMFTAGQLLTGLTLYFDIDPTGVSGLTQAGSLVNVVGTSTQA